MTHGDAMDGVKLQKILAELIRARIPLGPGCTGEAISVEQAVQPCPLCRWH
jgi:hypothetical protein